MYKYKNKMKEKLNIFDILIIVLIAILRESFYDYLKIPTSRTNLNLIGTIIFITCWTYLIYHFIRYNKMNDMIKLLIILLVIVYFIGDYFWF